MTEQLCDFPTCQLARKKGFDEPCMYAYIDRGKPKEVNPIMGHNVFDVFENQMKLEKRHPGAMEALRRRMENHMVINSERPPHVYGRPTQDLLERWLRERKDSILILINWDMVIQYTYHLIWGDVPSYQWLVETETFKTYELAREAAIVYALKLLPDAETKG